MPGTVSYPWKPDETQVSLDALKQLQRQNPGAKKFIEDFKNSPLVANGIWDRAPLHDKAATLQQPILAFTGELDVQTPVTELNKLTDACRVKGKNNFEPHVVPSVGHAFSAPRKPRGQPLLDLTLGPVSEQFLNELTSRVKNLIP